MMGGRKDGWRDDRRMERSIQKENWTRGHRRIQDGGFLYGGWAVVRRGPGGGQEASQALLLAWV